MQENRDFLKENHENSSEIEMVKKLQMDLHFSEKTASFLQRENVILKEEIKGFRDENHHLREENEELKQKKCNFSLKTSNFMIFLDKIQ